MLKTYTATNRKSGVVQTFKFNTENEKFVLPSGSQWAMCTMKKHYKNIAEVIEMVSETEVKVVETKKVTQVKNAEKLALVATVEDEFNACDFDLIPDEEMPNTVEDLNRYKDSARVAFIENVVLCFKNRNNFAKWDKYLGRAMKYYTKYESAKGKLYLLKSLA